MGVFTKNRSGSTPPPATQQQAIEEMLAKLGMSYGEFEAKAAATPALNHVLGLSKAVEQIGANLSHAYMVVGVDTPEGQKALVNAGIILLAAGSIADDLLVAIQGSLRV